MSMSRPFPPWCAPWPLRQVFCVAELPRLSEFWQVLVAVASGLLLLGAIFGFLQASQTLDGLDHDLDPNELDPIDWGSWNELDIVGPWFWTQRWGDITWQHGANSGKSIWHYWYLVNDPQMEMGNNFWWRAWPYGPIWDAHPKTTAIDVKTGVLSGFDPQTLAIIFYK